MGHLGAGVSGGEAARRWPPAGKDRGTGADLAGRPRALPSGYARIRQGGHSKGGPPQRPGAQQRSATTDPTEHVTETAVDLGGALEVADWRRRIAELYARVRGAADPAQGWADWCATRAALFTGHPQSPLPAGRRTEGHLPRYFPYDPEYRVLAEVEPVPAGTTVRLTGSTGQPFTVVRVGIATFVLRDTRCRLGVHWLTEYSGGLYVAFRDATGGTETYGAGRYLLDTAKGADLGAVDGRLVLDFNFAFQPSCSYDERWSCPLPPPDSTLAVRVEAGERYA